MSTWLLRRRCSEQPTQLLVRGVRAGKIGGVGFESSYRRTSTALSRPQCLCILHRWQVTLMISLLCRPSPLFIYANILKFSCCIYIRLSCPSQKPGRIFLSEILRSPKCMIDSFSSSLMMSHHCQLVFIDFLHHGEKIHMPQHHDSPSPKPQTPPITAM